MFNMVPGTCASDITTALLNQAVAGFSDSFFRSSFNCTQEEPVWSGTTDSLDRAIFCGYRQVRHGIYANPVVSHLSPGKLLSSLQAKQHTQLTQAQSFKLIGAAA